MNKWKVTRKRKNGTRWMVDPPGYGPGDREGQNWDDAGGKSFPTFAHVEALTYADRMARQVTLTLPRPGKETKIQGDYEGSFPMIVKVNWYGATELSIPSYPGFVLTPDEQNSLALTLLALARRKR